MNLECSGPLVGPGAAGVRRGLGVEPGGVVKTPKPHGVRGATDVLGWLGVEPGGAVKTPKPYNLPGAVVGPGAAGVRRGLGVEPGGVVKTPKPHGVRGPIGVLGGLGMEAGRIEEMRRRSVPEAGELPKWLREFCKKYKALRIRYEAHDSKRTVVRVEVFNGVTGKWEPEVRFEYDASSGAARRVAVFSAATRRWEPAQLQRRQGSVLQRIGIGVVAKETECAIGPNLAAPTGLDRLADVGTVVLAPETLVPKAFGMIAEAAALHVLPPPLARLVGDAAEQAVKRLFQPSGARGTAVKVVRDFDILSDLRAGVVTPAVANFAIEHLADEITIKGRP